MSGKYCQIRILVIPRGCLNYYTTSAALSGFAQTNPLANYSSYLGPFLYLLFTMLCFGLCKKNRFHYNKVKDECCDNIRNE